MVNRLKDAPEKSNGTGKCCHYWIVECPDGPTSRGVCQICGEEKEFDNYGPDSWSQWDRDMTKSTELSSAELPNLALAEEKNDL